MFGFVEIVGLEGSFQGSLIISQFPYVLSRLIKILIEQLIVHLALTGQFLSPLNQFVLINELFAQWAVIVTVYQWRYQVFNYLSVQN